MGRKVCILTTVHPPFDTRIFHKQAKTLAKVGYDVTLIAQHEGDSVVEGVRIRGLPKPRNRFTRIFSLTWRVFWLARRKRADIYHFHDPELLLIGVLLKLLTRAKVVYDVHEDVPQQILTKHWIPSRLRSLVASTFNFWEKFAARSLDAVITATEGIADKFTKVDPVVIHNYPDLGMLPNPSPQRKGDEHKVLIYVGGITRLRGAVEMVQVLEELEPSLNCRLELIGRFQPRELESELQALSVHKRVRPLGWMPWAEAWQRAQGALAGLVLFHPAPNHERALPNKLFEYMAAGLPVIASNFPLWREIVEGNNCGLCVDALAPDAIAEAIEYIFTHPEIARQMGENGRQAVEEKYNWETEAKKLLALYEELLE